MNHDVDVEVDVDVDDAVHDSITILIPSCFASKKPQTTLQAAKYKKTQKMKIVMMMMNKWSVWLKRIDHNDTKYYCTSTFYRIVVACFGRNAVQLEEQIECSFSFYDWLQ